MSRYYNKKLLSATEASAANSEIFTGLMQLAKDAKTFDILEEHGSNGGKGHGAKNETVSLSKVLISLLLNGDEEAISEVRQEMISNWKTLLSLKLPYGFHDNLICDAGQELSEALVCEAVAGYVFRGEPLKPFPNPIEYNLNDRAWLAGIADAVSEISKLLGNELMMEPITLEEELHLRWRYVEFGRNACKFLSLFSSTPSHAINASFRPGQGFQTKLVRATELVQRHQNEVEQLRAEVRRLDREVTK